MSNLKATAKGASWQTGSVLAQAVIGIAYIAIMSRLLEPSSFGIMAVVNVLVGFAVLFTEFGFGSALIQITDISKGHISSAYILSGITGILVFTILFFLSDPFIAFYDNAFDPLVLRVVSLVVIIRSFQIVSRSLLARQMDFKAISIIDVISILVGNLVVGTYLAFMGLEYWAIVIAQISVATISLVLYIIISKVKLSFAISRKELKEVMSFGSRLTLVRLFNISAKKVDKLLVGKFFGLDMLGFYERLQYVQELPLKYTGSALDLVLFSSFSKMKGDKQRLKQILIPFFNVIFFLFTLLSLIMYYYAELIIQLIAGPKWLEQIGVFKILCFVLAVNSLSRFCDTYIRSTGRLAQVVIVKAVFLLSMVGLLFIFNATIEEAAIAVLVASAIHSLLMIGRLLVEMRELSFKGFYKIFNSSILLICFAFVLNWMLWLSGIEYYGVVPILAIGGIILLPGWFLGSENVIMIKSIASSIRSKFISKRQS
jgi:PST family polysaccharide transporter